MYEFLLTVKITLIQCNKLILGSVSSLLKVMSPLPPLCSCFGVGSKNSIEGMLYSFRPQLSLGGIARVDQKANVSNGTYRTKNDVIPS